MEVANEKIIHVILKKGETWGRKLAGLNVSAIEKLTICGEMSRECIKYIHDGMLCNWFGSFRNCSALITIDSNNPKYKGMEGQICEK